MSMDAIDRKLLDLLQEEFPLSVTPYADLAERLEIPEEELLQRAKRLTEEGVIRRIGGVIDSKKMKYTSCLLAMKVPPERMEEAATLISACPGVTHNYERDDEYNLWFTLTAKGEDARDAQIRAWEEELKLPVYVFPGAKTYKRKVMFSMQKQTDGGKADD